MVKLSLLTAAYFLTAKIGIGLTVAEVVVTPVWAPTGIALAALLLFGRRMWVGVALGAFLANATSGVAIFTAAGIAVGNTLEAYVGARLLGRVGFRNQLDGVRDVVAFLAIGGVVATTISATGGTATLLLAGEIPPSSFASAWFLWWVGDTMGALLVAPLLLAWFTPRKSASPGGRGGRVEAVVLGLAVFGLSAILFFGQLEPFPLPLIFPLLIWAVLRFKQRGATSAVFVVAAIGLGAALYSGRSIGNLSLQKHVEILQAFMAVISIAMLILAAILGERERARDDLARHNRQHELLLSGMSDLGEGFLITDTVKALYANEAYFKICGYTMEELAGINLVDLAPEDERKKILERRSRRLAGEPVPDHYETALINSSGGRVDVEVSVKLTQVDGQPRVITVVRDISERKKTERQLEESYRREREASTSLRRLDELKSDFLSTVSHELRTPLTAIVGFTKTLESRWSKLDERTRRELIERLGDNADQLDALIRQLLDFSQLERGRVALRLEPKNLKEKVDSLIRGMGPILSRHHLEVSVGDGVHVLADDDAIGVVLRNLLTNATKFSPAGSRISIAAREAAGDVVVTVADEGIGIPAEEVPHIFERFYRVARGNSGTRGTGIGLAIAKDFCEAQGGRIWASPRNGTGTDFHFTLRRAPATPAAPAA